MSLSGWTVVVIILWVIIYVFTTSTGEPWEGMFERQTPTPEEREKRRRKRQQRRWRRGLGSLKHQQAAQEKKDRQTLEDEVVHSLAIYQEMVDYMYDNPGATVSDTVRHVGRSRHYPAYDEDPEWTGKGRR